MSDPRSSVTVRSGRALSISMLAAGLALGLGFVAGLASASAAPLAASAGLASPGLKAEDAAYKRSKNRSLYVEDSYGSTSFARSSQGMPFGGSDEVRELQRLHPETLWPPSMRYFPYH